jgi:hypothetical protein
LKKQLESNPNDEQAKKALAEAEVNLSLWQKASTAFGENGEVKKLFDLMEQGKLDKGQAQQLVDAMREGDIDKIIQTVSTNELKDDPNDTPEQKADKEKKKAELAAAAKKGGIGLLILLALIAAGTAMATGEALKGQQ